jgi:hypothetical protein
MNDSGGGITILVIIVAVALWFWQGDPARDMRRLFGQQTYEDQTAALAAFMSKNRVGSGQDVWLIKASFVPEPVAVFFGYVDDWGACQEFMTQYVQRYPGDSYRCEYVR